MQAHNERLEAIKARIAAALAIAAEGSGATPEEAVNAAAHAARLMLKYNLTEEQIRAAAGQKASEYERRTVLYTAKGASRYLHAQASLMGVLARYNFCESFRMGKSGEGILVGQSENIDIVIEAYMRLMPQVLKMGQTAYAAYEAACEARGYGIIAQEASWRRNHFAGVNSAIYYRLQAEREAAEQSVKANDYRADGAAGVSDEDAKLLTAATEGAQVMALVAIKDAALVEAVARFVPNAGKARNTTVRNGGAYRQGLRDGERLAIHNRKSVEG
jgi:hypothetical protein